MKALVFVFIVLVSMVSSHTVGEKKSLKNQKQQHHHVTKVRIFPVIRSLTITGLDFPNFGTSYLPSIKRRVPIKKKVKHDKTTTNK